MEQQQRQDRGVRLGDLDRSKAWVIAHTGRRWEVVGPIEAGALYVAVCVVCGASGSGGYAQAAEWARIHGESPTHDAATEVWLADEWAARSEQG